MSKYIILVNTNYQSMNEFTLESCKNKSKS